MKTIPLFQPIRILAISLLLINSISALAAGFSFIVDPSGAGVGITTTYLHHSPFNNFLIPGIVLFLVNGVVGMVVAMFTIKKLKYYPLLIMLQGYLLMGWIIIQVMLVKDFNGLHVACLVVGLLLIFCGNTLQQQKERNY